MDIIFIERFIYSLVKNNCGLSYSDIVSKTNISPGSLSKIINKMNKKKLVQLCSGKIFASGDHFFNLKLEKFEILKYMDLNEHFLYVSDHTLKEIKEVISYCSHKREQNSKDVKVLHWSIDSAERILQKQISDFNTP